MLALWLDRKKMILRYNIIIENVKRSILYYQALGLVVPKMITMEKYES